MKRVMTEEKIVQAQKMKGEGASYKKIGAALGVSSSAVHTNLTPCVQERNRAYYAAYYASHKEAISKSRVRYCATHKTKRLTTTAAYRVAHKEEIAASNAAYRVAHKEEEAIRHAVYQRSHRAEIAAQTAARKALKMSAMIGATANQIAEIRAIYKNAKEDPKIRCYLCGQWIPLGERHVDHVKPLSKGGVHRPANLAVACASCNMQKHTKLPEEIGILL